MTKLDKKLHEQHAKRLQAIINPASTFVPHLTRPEFNTLLKLELNTLAELEKKLPEDKLDKSLTSAELLKQFNTLTKSEFKLGEKFKYDDEADLIDNINYLPTYCKNIFKVELDDLVGGKKVVAENPNINLRSTPDAGVGDPGMDAASAFNMGAMGFSAGPYENPFLMGQAYARLNKDINEGKVYQYKSKPKIIPIMKWILTILIGMCCLMFLITGILCFAAHGLQVNYQSESEVKVGNLSTITNGMFYLIVAGMGGYVEYLSIRSIIKPKGKTNENSLYSFSWPFYIGFIILGLLISLLDLRQTWFINSYYSNFIGFVSKSGTHWNAFQGWKISICIDAALAGLSLIPTIIGAVKNPKIDKPKIDQILKQYIDETLKNSPGAGVYTGPMGAPVAPAGADVQKPVEVKPVGDKKDKKDPSSKKPEEPKK